VTLIAKLEYLKWTLKLHNSQECALITVKPAINVEHINRN